MSTMTDHDKGFKDGLRAAMRVCDQYAQWADREEAKATTDEGKIEANAESIAAGAIRSLLADMLNGKRLP